MSNCLTANSLVSMSQFIEMFEGDKYPSVKLSYIASEWLKGQSFRKDDIVDNGNSMCIHYGELFTKYGPIINQVLSRTNVEGKRTSKVGDILFPASDVTPNGLARCSMLPYDNIILGGDIIVLRPKRDCNAAYLSYAINQQTAQLLIRVNGAVVKHMSAKALMTVVIPMPPLEEQNRFVSLAQQADKSKFVGSKSQFIEMFENHNYMSVPLAELIDKSFPGEWGTEDENGNGTKVIRTTNITNSDKLDLSDVVTRNIVAAKLQKKQLCRGDILLERSGGTKDNPVGRVAYFDEDGVFVTNNFTQTLRCNNNIESRYLFYFLYYFYNLNKMKIRSMGNQTTGIQNLNMDDYMQISVIVPPRDLQKQFISIVTQADKSKFELRQAIEKIDKVMKSLLQ